MQVAQPVQVIQPMQVAQPYQAPVKQNPYSGIVKNKLGSNADLSNAKVSSSNTNSNNGTITNQSDFLAAAYPVSMFPPVSPTIYGGAATPLPPSYSYPTQYPQGVGGYQQMPAVYPQQMPYQQMPAVYPQQMPTVQQGGYQPGSAYPKF